jgi:hypothetical protein
MPAVQARYWILTIPYEDFTPYVPPNVDYIKGQLEQGASGYVHWQVVVHFPIKKTLHYLKFLFGDRAHAEPTKSEAASDYVWKEETRVEGTQFELGRPPINRNKTKDWDLILENARDGKFNDIPADVLIRCYGSIKKIRVDSLRPEPFEKQVFCFWGATGAGKSRRAWDEAGMDAYPKDPNTKFWDGYSGQLRVVIDEFRGTISISHILRWLDRYPVIVEVKGSSCVLCAREIWFTSNLDPRLWYPDLDDETKKALLRRFTQIIHFDSLT